MKLLFVFGTRPEAIKMAPVIQAAKSGSPFDVRVCVTGQHRDMLDQVLAFFSIQPDYDLNVMQPEQDLNGLVGRMLSGLRPVILAERPDLTVVQGDTVSALAGSLASFFEQVPVAHVEAGLRTYDLDSPFPEEALRQMIARVTTIHFAPTKRNQQALVKEGISIDQIFVTGNTVIDAVLWTFEKIRQQEQNPLVGVLDPHARQAIDRARHLVLVTGHRRENMASGLRNVCEALAEIADRHPEAVIMFPIHPNPAVRSTVEATLMEKRNVVLLPPLDYPSFVWLMYRSSVVVSDSGGVQEETAAFGKPLLITRKNTERIEAVENGIAAVVGTDRNTIVTKLEEIFKAEQAGIEIPPNINIFGDGSAAERIVHILLRRLETSERVTRSLVALARATNARSVSALADAQTESVIAITKATHGDV